MQPVVIERKTLVFNGESLQQTHAKFLDSDSDSVPSSSPTHVKFFESGDSSFPPLSQPSSVPGLLLLISFEKKRCFAVYSVNATQAHSQRSRVSNCGSSREEKKE
jgi:hypothetical protein